MCVLCSQLWIEEHWSEAGSGSPDESGNIVVLESHALRRGERLRARTRRTRLFNLLLAHRGLSLQDWEGSRYILRDAKGRTAVIPNLAGVWREVERMTGAPLDPLNGDFLQTVQNLVPPGKREP